MKPAPRHISCEIAFLALFAATLAGNWGGMREFAERCVDDASEWGGRNFRGNGEHTDAFRDIAEKFVTSGETLYYCANGVGGRLQPAERSTHLALSWARSPDPVAFGSADGAGKSSAIIASRFLKVDFPGYTHIVGNGNANLWLRDDIAADGSGDEDGREPTAPSPWREAAGTLVACALIAVFAWQMRTAGIEKKETSFGVASRVSPAICATAFFMLAAAAALTHTFMAPTGLGVHGGKAKLFYLAGGIPGGFFTDPAFSSYQPAYPPGFALLTLLSYWVSGGCGEWLTQLVPVFAAAAALWLTAGGGAVSRIAALWILAAFLNQQTLQMATLYYAEPFVALLVLLGWKRLQENRTDRRGWVLIGAAGFFKTEGLILLSVA